MCKSNHLCFFLCLPYLFSGPAEHAGGVRGVRAAQFEAERAAAGHLPAGQLSDQLVPAAGAEPRPPGQRPAERGHVPQLAAQRLRHVCEVLFLVVFF